MVLWNEILPMHVDPEAVAAIIENLTPVVETSQSLLIVPNPTEITCGHEEPQDSLAILGSDNQSVSTAV